MLYPWPPPHLCQAPPDQVCSSAKSSHRQLSKERKMNFQPKSCRKIRVRANSPNKASYSCPVATILLHVEGLWWLLFAGGHIDFAFSVSHRFSWKPLSWISPVFDFATLPNTSNTYRYSLLLLALSFLLSCIELLLEMILKSSNQLLNDCTSQ